MNVLVVFGSRTIEPPFGLLDSLSYAHDVPFDEVISGGARGVDTRAELWAESKDKRFRRYDADWEGNGRAAGYLRNTVMAERATHGICVWDGESRGTKHMLDEMRRLGKPVAVYITGSGVA